ncbi:DUF3813 domain-containing protein [Litchfieldia salsa]|uniref:DUF3813 domain-containing protein n=1 Tax=Litchfieldia salsa TaxID=930152 RepID=A0A1H0UKV1_9BACI|nr:DUF3813 domain-containing protein [Litchfieldia salsa]SDP66952.1 Protein of unknown function [Litchfieldia salsa]
MANPLFQQARETVAIAEKAQAGQVDLCPIEAMNVAKNALSSAFANSTTAEKEQLHDLQDRLDQLQ